MLAAMASLAVAAATLAALIEALYYHLRVGVKLTRVLDANLGFDIGLSAAWIVLAITLGVVALGAARMAIASLAQRAAPAQAELAAAPTRRA